jgi:hypothetical protein
MQSEVYTHVDLPFYNTHTMFACSAGHPGQHM